MYVELLMKEVGVQKYFAHKECHRGTSGIGCPIAKQDRDKECEGCVNSSKMKDIYKYPEFTYEKQIKLIKLFSYFSIQTDNEITMTCKAKDNRYYKTEGHISFEEVLAKLILHLVYVQALDIKVVKEILQ